MNKDYDIWAKTLESIKNMIDPISYDTWFKNIDFIDIKNSTLRLSIPIMWYKTHIEQNYKNIIFDAINDLLTTPVDNIIYILIFRLSI